MLESLCAVFLILFNHLFNRIHLLESILNHSQVYLICMIAHSLHKWLWYNKLKINHITLFLTDIFRCNQSNRFVAGKIFYFQFFFVGIIIINCNQSSCLAPFNIYNKWSDEMDGQKIFYTKFNAHQLLTKLECLIE